MTPIAEALALALQHHQTGDLARAEALFRQILQADPQHAEAIHFLGAIALQAAKYDLAIDYMKQSIAIMPLHAGFHANLGVAHQTLGKVDEAIACYREALRLRPDFADTDLRLADLLQKLGRLEEAVACYRQALRWLPNSVQAHNNLGSALCALAKWDEAAVCYRAALSLQPDSADICFNLGHVLAEQKDLDGAVACYRQALQLRPGMAEAHAALGWVLSDQGQADQAVACLQEAVRLRPSDRLRVALATRLPVIYQSLGQLEAWRERLIRQVGDLRTQGVALDLTDQPALNLFYLVYQGLNDRDLQRQLAGLYRPPAGNMAKPQAAGGKIRVGIVSSLLKAHTIGFWVQGLIAQLSRDDFTVTVFSVGSHDDEVARFIKQHADRYLEVPRNLPSARRLIAEQQLDVLLYPDLGMDPITYSLAFSRLAPVQCVTVGHPVTSGIGTIDYFISTEALEIAEAEQHYTEKLIRLKTLPIYFYRPELPAGLKPREYFGLAKRDHIYTCLQYLFKFHPQFDELLGGILRGDPQGVLVLSRGLVPQWEQLLRQRFAVTLPDVADRVRFLPLLSYADYLNLLAVADVQLDPVGFGGGSTSYEGLAVGTPIVTLPSRLMRGRITFALYNQMQLLDCVAATPQEYIEKALRLGTDSDFRTSLRQHILEANNVLYHNSAGIRELEHFFQAACGLARC